MADRLDELVHDAAGAGAVTALASIHAANRVLVGWLDMANVESGWPGLNEEVVVVGPQTFTTKLVPGEFVNWEGDELAAPVQIAPDTLEPGGVTAVRLWVDPVEGTPDSALSGTYMGSLRRAADDFVLVDEIGLYVVGKSVPPLPAVE